MVEPSDGGSRVGVPKDYVDPSNNALIEFYSKEGTRLRRGSTWEAVGKWLMIRTPGSSRRREMANSFQESTKYSQ